MVTRQFKVFAIRKHVVCGFQAKYRLRKFVIFTGSFATRLSFLTVKYQQVPKSFQY